MGVRLQFCRSFPGVNTAALGEMFSTKTAVSSEVTWGPDLRKAVQEEEIQD